jgi:hypothetical protein
MADFVVFANRRRGFSCGKPRERLPALGGCQLEFWTELDGTRLSSGSPFECPRADKVPFDIGKAAKDGDH